MAGTIVLSQIKHHVINDPLFKEIVATCEADVSAATFPTTSTGSQFIENAREEHSFSRAMRGWYLSKIGVNPGSPAPSANSSIYFNDSDGRDLLGGAGEAIIHDSNSTEARPLVKGFSCSQPITTDISIIISRNSVNSAVIVIKFTLTRNPY